MEEIRMTTKELKRVDVLALVTQGQMKMSQGAEELGVTKRHLRKMCRRYEKEGGKGIAHKSRGRAINRTGNKAFSVELNHQIIELLHRRYDDFGPTFAAEKISEEIGKKISKEKVRQLQIQEGLWKSKKEKERKYHPRRIRRSRRGELVQIDGSNHDWLEEREERMTLISFVDDATSETIVGRFAAYETTTDYMELLIKSISRNGGYQKHYIATNIVFSGKIKKKGI